jgi:hypothetical protein
MAPSNDEPAIAVRSEEPEAPAQASEPAPSVRPAANYTPLLGSMHVADVAELSQAEHPTGKDHVVKEPTPSVSIPIVEASAPMTMASTSEFEHDTDEMVVARPEETPMVSVAKSDDEPIKVPEQRTWLAVLLTAVVLAVLGWAVFSGGRPGSASGSRTVQEPVEVTVQPGQGVLEIVPPPGASLTVDGATRAAAPRVILPVAEGTHDVRVGEQSKQIQVRSSRLTQVVFDTP